MNKPDALTIEILRGIQTEIGAGMVLCPNSEGDYVHNNACERAKAIISNYVEGCGLFQMTRRRQPTQETAGSLPITTE